MHQGKNREHIGIVLAAGASVRMGSPKALLKTPRGTPLVLHQAELLKQGGCTEVAVVLGCNGGEIAEKLTGVTILQNPKWESGRPSSVLTALEYASSYAGIFVLPVDTVGVKPATIIRVLIEAEATKPPALRPTYKGIRGKLVWLSHALAQQIQSEKLTKRLDDYLESKAVEIETDDSAILSNINTPDDWGKISERI